MYLFMTKVFLRHCLRPWNMLKIDPNYTFVVVACSTGETTDSMRGYGTPATESGDKHASKYMKPFLLPFTSDRMSAASDATRFYTTNQLYRSLLSSSEKISLSIC